MKKKHKARLGEGGWVGEKKSGQGSAKEVCLARPFDRECINTHSGSPSIERGEGGRERACASDFKAARGASARALCTSLKSRRGDIMSHIYAHTPLQCRRVFEVTHTQTLTLTCAHHA